MYLLFMIMCLRVGAEFCDRKIVLNFSIKLNGNPSHRRSLPEAGPTASGKRTERGSKTPTAGGSGHHNRSSGGGAQRNAATTNGGEEMLENWDFVYHQLNQIGYTKDQARCARTVCSVFFVLLFLRKCFCSTNLESAAFSSLQIWI
jgi:hypothetical protein